MKRCLLLALGACLALHASTQLAQAQIDRRDRLLLFYNYYQNQQNSRQILQNQQRIRSGVREFRDVQNQRRQELDPIQRYIRRGGPAESERPLPPIYSGGGGRSQYFMRFNQFGTQLPSSQFR